MPASSIDAVVDGGILPTGQQGNIGTIVWPGAAIDTADALALPLGHAVPVSGICLQADNNDTSRVSDLGLDPAWHTLAGIDPNTDSNDGLGDRTVSFRAITATAFEIQA